MFIDDVSPRSALRQEGYVYRKAPKAHAPSARRAMFIDTTTLWIRPPQEGYVYRRRVSKIRHSNIALLAVRRADP